MISASHRGSGPLRLAGLPGLGAGAACFTAGCTCTAQLVRQQCYLGRHAERQ